MISFTLRHAKGSPEQNRKYCTKDDTRIAGPWERGEMPASGQGKRNDIIKVVNHIKEKGFMSAAEAYPVNSLDITEHLWQWMLSL